MNRRDFFSRASLAVAGIAAACGMLPELAKAEAPTVDPFSGVQDVAIRPDAAIMSPAEWNRAPFVQTGMRQYITSDAYLRTDPKPHIVHIETLDRIMVEW